jgi:hypothetical protein
LESKSWPRNVGRPAVDKSVTQSDCSASSS